MGYKLPLLMDKVVHFYIICIHGHMPLRLALQKHIVTGNHKPHMINKVRTITTLALGKVVGVQMKSGNWPEDQGIHKK